jgi:hypothetical protein
VWETAVQVNLSCLEVEIVYYFLLKEKITSYCGIWTWKLWIQPCTIVCVCVCVYLFVYIYIVCGEYIYFGILIGILLKSGLDLDIYCLVFLAVAPKYKMQQWGAIRKMQMWWTSKYLQLISWVLKITSKNLWCIVKLYILACIRWHEKHLKLSYYILRASYYTIWVILENIVN